MSNTPETEDLLKRVDDSHEFVDFARKLERERNEARDDFYSALKLLQRIREVAGDSKGKLMQDEFVEHIRNLKKSSQ